MEDQQSWSVLFDRIAANVQEIVRSEVRLAKTEMTDEARKAAKAGVSIGVGVVLALFAAWFILVCIALVLNFVLAAWLAVLIVGLLLGLAASIFLSGGVNQMKKVSKPARTIQSAKETVQWAKSQSS